MATIVEAARTVLEQKREPLHVRDICKAICDQDLYSFKAKDPLAALTSALYTHSPGRKTSSGKGAIFENTAPGTFGLTEWANSPGDS